MLKAIIMAGGSGTRFWPLSRQALPKQFLKLHGDRTLIQQAVDRIVDLVTPEGVLVVTNEAHIDRTAEQLPAIPRSNIVGEPVGRDTAACIALAGALCLREDPSARMIVLAADHLIDPQAAFHDAVRAAEAHLDRRPNALVTFGIKPTFASTGYGYLHRGRPAGTYEGVPVFELNSFCEKPQQPRADEFFASGEHYWNSGIFVWNAKTVMDQIAERAPATKDAVERIAKAWGAPAQADVFAKEYDGLKKISIDHAVMEHAPEVAMVQAPFQWDDVGSWLALERTQPSTGDGNTIVGQHVGIDTERCVVVGEGKHLIATIGVEDLIIVHTPDVTLVARREDEQKVKEIQQSLAPKGLKDFM